MAFQGASFSSSFTRQWAYDVFLSFRSEDTGTNFTAHLYEALRRKGIITFMDDKVTSGEEISPTLLEAIEESEISIIVFSQNYASSICCLGQLMKILECAKTKGQQVIPVFYNADQSEIWNQNFIVEKAFVELEEKFKDDEMKKQALKEAANFPWKPLGERIEPEFIREIIGWVNSILVKKTQFQVAQYPVGIESRVQAVKLLLDIEKNDRTCMVGIFGAGGIGKTTLVKAIYNSIASQFQRSCFLEDIRETSGQKDGLIHLQNKLHAMILGRSGLKVKIVDQGITLTEQVLCNLRVLLVLDDVDNSVQLKKLVGKGDWLGLGSRIIIATRDKRLLTAHGVDSIYQVNELDNNEALQLFSWHAFNRDKPHDQYEEVAAEVIRYSGGLPLALTLLGSTLKGRDAFYWKNKLEEYKRIPHDHILENLRISYDGLNGNAKNIFLDIACFFKGEKVEYVTKILDSCGFDPYSGIEELKDKCLITQPHGTLEMHGLVQDVGREIVRQESPNEPSKRSRLWFHEDVCYVLEENMGKSKVEGILIDLPNPDHIVHMSPKTFKKMKRLRLFISRNARFSEEPNILSNELRVIDWAGYPGESFPSNFWGYNLVVLSMAHSRIKILKHFYNLQIMNFNNCKFLEKIPDMTMMPMLESLKVVGCKNLVEVHHSVGFLIWLNELIITSCSNLISFPKSFTLRSLKYLTIFGCTMLKNFPEILCIMEFLEDIYFQDTSIEELPSSIVYLVGLKELHLDNSKNLMNLPDNIYQLQHLEKLSLDNCYSLKELPLSIGYLGLIKQLNLTESGIVTLPRYIESFFGLKYLNLDGCKQLQEILGLPPNVEMVSARDCVSLDTFLEGSRRSQLFNTKDPLALAGVVTKIATQQSLRVLDLSGSAIVSLPTWFNEFFRLEKLRLANCKQLREILGLPPNVKKLSAWNCSSLEVFLEPRRCPLFNKCVPPDPLRVEMVSSALQPLEHKFQLECSFNSLDYLDLSGSAIISLPTFFNRFVRLIELHLEGCKQLREVPKLPRNIEYVYLGGCTSLERLPFDNIFALAMLHKIDFFNCPEQIGNVVHNRLFSEGHPRGVYRFECIYPGNRIPDGFSYCKEVSNTHFCEIDTGPVHLDSEYTTFAFLTVFGMRDVGQDEDYFGIHVQVFNNGQSIHYDVLNSYHSSLIQPATSDHVWLNYTTSNHSQLKTDNLRVIFKSVDATQSMVFKSCGFHIEQRYERKTTKRRRDDDDMATENPIVAHN